MIICVYTVYMLLSIIIYIVYDSPRPGQTHNEYYIRSQDTSPELPFCSLNIILVCSH